jgi:hypothetical protein
MNTDIEISAIDIGKQIAVLTDASQIDKIVSHLSGGGTMIDYCRLVGVQYSVMMQWINADRARVAKYEVGKRAREDWLFERVLEEYTALSTLNLADLYDKNGALKPSDEWGKLGACIAGVDSMEIEETVDGERVHVGTLKKVKLYDKTKTLDSLGRYLKMFREQIDINVQGQVSLVSALEEAEKRARTVGGQEHTVEANVVRDEPI